MRRGTRTKPIGFRRSIAAALLVGALGGPSGAQEPAGSGDLTVVFTGLKSDEGQAIIRLVRTAEAFGRDDEAGTLAARVPVENGRAVHVFRAVPYGELAVKAFHDVNANEKLDTNFIGLPKESFGFSKDAMGRFGPPGFDDCRIRLETPERTIEIVAKRL